MQKVNRMKAKEKEFITLRADGLSFDKIAKKINTSKSTLIKWSRLYQNEINDLQFQSMIILKEQYEHTKKNKYKILLEQLQKVDNAILEKDLTESSLKELFLIKSNIDNQLQRLEDKTILTDSGLQCFNEYTNQNEMLQIKLNDV